LTSKRFDEFVSSFHVQEERKLIIAASGEGTIQVQSVPFHTLLSPSLPKYAHKKRPTSYSIILTYLSQKYAHNTRKS